MITLCWAAKGGSGTTVTTAARALAGTDPTLLVDLAGDLPAVLGLPEPDGPGVHDWLRSDAPGDRLTALELGIDDRLALLPSGRRDPFTAGRWAELAAQLHAERRAVVVDAGTATPHRELVAVADHAWLVTRPCYLALRAAVRQACRPTGIVLVDEPGRALSDTDVEAALGAPVVATVLLDPAVARAVDSGLLLARLPAPFRRRLRDAA